MNNTNKTTLKTRVTEVINTVDSETGEILDTSVKKHSYLSNDKESFYLAYASLNAIFMEMTITETRVFAYFMEHVGNDGNSLGLKSRVKISKRTGIHQRTIYNSIPSLIEKKILYKDEDGAYHVNPRFAFKGSNKDRNEKLKAIIELNCPDC